MQMKPLENFLESIAFINNIAEDIISYSKVNDKIHKPYWVKSTTKFSNKIHKKIVKTYIPEKTPDNEMFVSIREKFRNIYEMNEDLFSLPLVNKEGETKKLNDEWLRIEDPIREEDFLEDPENEDGLMTSNRGLVIKLADANKNIKDDCNTEFAASEIYRHAIYVNKYVTKKPNFVLGFMYGFLNCIKYSAPEKELDPMVDKIISELFDRREEILSKPKNKTDKAVTGAKDMIEDLLGDNMEDISDMLGEMNESIENLTDQDIDDLSGNAHSIFKNFDGGVDSGISGLISNITGFDKDEVNEKIEYYVGNDNIKKMFNKVAGIKEEVISNKDLLSSVPKTNQLDEFFKS